MKSWATFLESHQDDAYRQRMEFRFLQQHIMEYNVWNLDFYMGLVIGTLFCVQKEPRARATVFIYTTTYPNLSYTLLSTRIIAYPIIQTIRVISCSVYI